jgi:hypothetical protein
MVLGGDSMRIVKPLCAGMLFCLLSNHAFAADVSVLTSTQLLNQALADEQSNQSSFDTAYQQAASNAYLDVENGIVLSKEELESALKTTISQQTSYGNTDLASYLSNILAWLENDTSDFSNTYSSYLTSGINTSLDQEAVSALQNTIAADYATVANSVTAAQKQIEESISSVGTYLDYNLSTYNAVGQSLPDIIDGSTASIFFIDTNNSCYYLNAGDYSGVLVGSVYGITNSNGDAIGYIKILKVSPTYSAGALINTNSQDDISVGNPVPSLKTCRVQANS